MCSYDSSDQRITTALYIKSLEKKVNDLEELVDRRTPCSDGLDPASAANGRAEAAAKSSFQTIARTGRQAADEEVIETMVGAREDDLVNERSLEQYRPNFAGLSLLQRVQNLCRHVSGMPWSPTTVELQDDLVRAFDSKTPSLWLTTSCEAFPLLPLPENMDYAIDVVINRACCNMQFLDGPSLRSIARRIYAEAETESRDHHDKSLALLYAVLALAKRFEAVPSNAATTTGQGSANG